MKQASLLGLLMVVTLLLVRVAAQTTLPDTGVRAEALGQANLRATFALESDQVGEIFNGTLYPVVGRSEFFPWLLLADPDTLQPLGWVFRDLVTVTGNLNAVPFSTFEVNAANPTLTPTLAPSATPTLNPDAAVLLDTTPQVTSEFVITPGAAAAGGGQQVPSAPAGPTFTPSPTATLAASVIGIVRGEINVRYGPGIDYPRIGVAQAGLQVAVTAYHTQFPWLQIAFPEAPNGAGWVARDLLDVQGNVFSLPAISTTNFALPTLTPTPPVLNVSAPPGQAQAEVTLSPGFEALADNLWATVFNSGFDPQTSRFGALFVMDLQTREAITFGEDFAFSGTSLNKIAILAALYGRLPAPPDTRTATDIANTMICSENVATNRLLSAIGGGDEYAGAEQVSNFLNALGLGRTFITAPYITDPSNPPTPPRPIRLPQTSADQSKSSPDPSNQMTVEELGWLMADIYDCAYNEGGRLMERFPGQYEPRECRQMLHVMSNNNVDALLKAGVPADTRVAHKHGWIPDTHGNAALFFTPGGDYVVTMMLHQPQWLAYNESLPVIAEVSRQIYNYFNPENPQPNVREGFIPEAASCNYEGTPLVSDLREWTWDR